MKTIPCAALLTVKDRKLLLAYSKNKKCFYLPGGKIDVNESAAQALCREIEEELNVPLQVSDLKYYTHITAPAFGEMNGTIMEQDCFLVNKTFDPVASAEIGELRYFSLEEYLLQQNTTPNAVRVLEILKEDKLID